MINQQRTTSVWIRLIAIILGVSILFWLPIEDKNETFTILLAYIISSLFSVAFLLKYKNQSSSAIFKYILAGILVGAIVTPLILFLMVFKTGVHAHPIPDYSYEQIFSIINRTPIWAISGFFTGIGLGIAINYLPSQQESYRAIER